MTILYIILFTYFTCNIILKIISFRMYLLWDKRIRKELQVIKYQKNEMFWIIIPVYKESNVIEKSYYHFLDIINNSRVNISIIYVGTIRENPNRTLNLLKKLPKNTNINILNANLSRKFMAGQINYAIWYIDKKQKNYKFAIYNVDSRPDIKSIENNFKLLSEYPVVQQYGDYSNNIPKQNKTFRDFIYLNTFFWQNSWSKLFEIRNTELNRLFKKALKFSYVVGHGLFLNRYILDITGLLSEKFQNEDLELSIRLHENNIPIKAGYGFSKSDMAINISDYIKQQTVWARGPMLALNYVDNRKQIIPAIKLFILFIYWMFEPMFMLVLIISAILTGNIYILLLTLMLFMIYFKCVLVLPNMQYFYIIKKYPLKYLLSCFMFFIVHAFGPILALKNFIFETIGIKKQHKFKTPKI